MHQAFTNTFPLNTIGDGQRIAVEGQNCWQIAHARRLAFFIDAAAYFRCFKAAALQATHSIFIIGWDVNSRTLLEYPDDAAPDVPNELGPFLDYLAHRRAGLHIRVLDWDSPLVFGPDREWAPRIYFDWFTHPRLCFALDDEHPLGASHHQKLVVIDDSLAFLGGIDLTDSRLDGSEHRPDDARRRNADGSAYGPYHDVQTAVDGAAAQALAAIARDRWTRATGQRLTPSPTLSACWPADLVPAAEHVAVAIARTYPLWKGRREIREIEAMWIDAIAAARQSIYIENQYFCAERIAQAIIERLGEDEGPEFVLVLPPQSSGWLERAAMGSKQQRLLALVRSASRNRRFRVYGPVVGEDGSVGVKVHSKLMIVDGHFLNIGSANLNNRSLGLDSECNIAIEDTQGSLTQQAVMRLRNRLLAEHLDVPPDRLAREIKERGSLIAAIEALRGPGRSLNPLPEASPDVIDAITADLELLDPAAPAMPERIAYALASGRRGRMTLRSAIVRLAIVLALLLALATFWRWGPLAESVDAGTLPAWERTLSGNGVATLALLVTYVAGGLVMFPVLVLIAATGLFYGPVSGMLVAGIGSVLSATAGYGVGRLLGRRLLRRLTGGRLSRISEHLARRGLVSMTVIRLLPVAPFTLVNLAAGASHIRFRDYFLGTILGMAPGITAITAFSGQLWRVVRSPDAVNIGILIGLAALILAATLFCWRRFARRGHAEAGA